jgi:GTP-binding protein Era
MYPEGYYTDQTPEFRIAEVIREKAIERTTQEIPHALYVELADMEWRREGKELWVRAFLLWKERARRALSLVRGDS